MPKPTRAPRTAPRTETPVASRVSVGMGASSAGQKPERVWTRPAYPEDKHRRRWHVTESTITGTPTSILPMFRAPVMPPHDCIRIDTERPWFLVIDYQKWLGRLIAEEREHLAIRREVARREYKEAARGREESERVIELTGPKPGDIRTRAGFASNAKLVALAFHGDPWALGKVKERTAAVAAIIGEEEEEMDVAYLLDTGGKFSSEVKKLLGETAVTERHPDDDELDEELDDEALEEQALQQAGGHLEPTFEEDQPLEGIDESFAAEDDRVAQFGTESPGALRELASTTPDAVAPAPRRAHRRTRPNGS